MSCFFKAESNLQKKRGGGHFWWALKEQCEQCDVLRVPGRLGASTGMDNS